MCALCQTLNYEISMGDTVYTWRPGSGSTYVNGKKSFAATSAELLDTIADGGGTDTYDLSAYESNLEISLVPDQWSLFSKDQLVGSEGKSASPGNVLNSSPDSVDARYLMENAIGGSGNDKIRGNFAANELIGNAGADQLLGGIGDDRLIGRIGSDKLSGGRGSDVLFGGQGANQFIFSAPDSGGLDVIRNFSRGEDKIVLRDFDRAALSEILKTVAQEGNDVELSLGEGWTLIVSNFEKAELSMSDFLLI